jgi:hypothetical protein
VSGVSGQAACSSLGDHAVCSDLCSQATSAAVITISGDVLDWHCIGLHPKLERIQALAPVACFGVPVSGIESGVRCKSASSVRPDVSLGKRLLVFLLLVFLSF